ncbi:MULTISPECIES: hypothetical protein [unclassified Marinovum]|uniref:hypothetical protein n=1 Tax=unclassified Marinovum TaxID=2647166 RepID=UPI003EDC66FF
MNLSINFTITKMTVISAPATSTGSSLMATFDMRVAGIKICGCVLVQKKSGKIMMCGPKGKTHTGHDIGTHIENREIREAVTEHAVKLYEEFTGSSVAAE